MIRRILQYLTPGEAGPVDVVEIDLDLPLVGTNHLDLHFLYLFKLPLGYSAGVSLLANTENSSLGK